MTIVEIKTWRGPRLVIEKGIKRPVYFNLFVDWDRVSWTKEQQLCTHFTDRSEAEAAMKEIKEREAA